MADNRAEQKEALETLVEFNERLLKNMRFVNKELAGARLEDTDVFLGDILKAINWEIQVINGTMELLNEGKERIRKEEFNQVILELNDAVVKKDDAKMAEAFEKVIPEFENLEAAAHEVLA